MAVYLTRTKTLIDIANAIRFQNGESRIYKPTEMAAAIEALDGTKEQEGFQASYSEPAYGKLSGNVYYNIAQAIRKQNGLEKSLRPTEMAAAIRDLSWERKTEAYALVCKASDSSLELRFMRDVEEPRLNTPHAGGVITAVYTGFEDGEYTTNSKVPWYTNHADIKAVYFDDVVKPKSCAYWFYWMSACTKFDLAKLDTSECTSFAFMFYSCTALTDIDLTALVTSQVKTINYMFYNCTKLENIRFGAWDMTNVGVWAQAFRNLTAITQLDFSNCVLPDYTSTMYYCFYNCQKLERIYVPAGTDMSDTGLAGYCFSSCRALVGGNGTTFNTANVTAAYARVDGMGGMPGYFTAK